MHYRINNQLIKSEYAAKSPKQANKEIVKIINSLPTDYFVLDYGCGKLRYTIPLSKRVNKVYSIDSSEQVNRKQLINGERITIKKYCEKYIPNVNIFELQDDKWRIGEYNFILCANVLSAIPLYSERIKVFKNISNLLRSDGIALISTQYRNSYFNSYNLRKDCKKYYDGWIICGKQYPAFYGIVTLEKMISYAKRSNLSIRKAYKKDGSAYLMVGKNF